MKTLQFIKNIFLKNSSGQVINPATEEKQDQNIALLEEIRSLSASIKELAREQARFSSLRPSELPYAKTSSDQMRVNVDSGTIAVSSISF